MTVNAAQVQAAKIKIAGILALKPEDIELVDVTEPNVIHCVRTYRKKATPGEFDEVTDRMVVDRITPEQYAEALSQPALAKRNAALAADWDEYLQGELSYRFTVKLATQITVTLKGYAPFVFTYGDTLVHLVNDLHANRAFIIPRLQFDYAAIRNQQRLTTDITPAQLADALVTAVDNYIAHHRLSKASIGLFHGGRGFQHATLLKETALASEHDMVIIMRAWVMFSGQRNDGSQCRNTPYSLNRFILNALKNYRLWSAEIYLTGIDAMVDYHQAGADTCQALIDCLPHALHKLEQKALVVAPEAIVPLVTNTASMPVQDFNDDEEETKTAEQLEYWAAQGQPLTDRRIAGIKQAASTVVRSLASFDSPTNTLNDAALNLLADDAHSLSQKQGTTL